ncbi:MAG TPA: hypothetical protein VHH36_09100 [Candidatus Thermoplasmatota archaeon]|nr:hypothetical protein [Candidatus Thermoplasmatota archaeon]
MRALLLLAALPLALAAPAAADPADLSAPWLLGPGSPLRVERPDGETRCTAGLVLAAGGARYFATAGHCLLPADATATHGAGADYDAARTTVWACVARCEGSAADLTGAWVLLGRPAYARQPDAAGGLWRDFGLVEVPASLGGALSTGVPVCGGPDPAATGDRRYCLFANGAPKAGLLLDGPSGWSGTPSTVDPGDAGAPVVRLPLDVHGARTPVGILTRLLPTAGGPTVAQMQAMGAEAGLWLTPVV